MLLYGWYFDFVMLCNVYLIGVKVDWKLINLRLVNRLFLFVDFFNNFLMILYFLFLVVLINFVFLFIFISWWIVVILWVFKVY